jgi:flagellar assembly protein FliH
MSTIIKSGGSTRNIQRIALNLEDLKRNAATYLEKVRSQADQIIADANRQAEGVRKRAEEEGKQAAMQAAEKVLDVKVGQRMQSALPALQQVIAGIADAKQAWLGHWERCAVKLATAIAAKVLRRAATDAPDVTLALVREGLEMAAGSTKIRIHLHPTDHDTLKGQVNRLAEELRQLGQSEVVADPEITAGGCRIETLHGAIDQQFETQLARIEEELTRGNDASS